MSPGLFSHIRCRREPTVMRAGREAHGSRSLGLHQNQVTESGGGVRFPNRASWGLMVMF